jgi:hypothetical protein
LFCLSVCVETASARHPKLNVPDMRQISHGGIGSPIHLTNRKDVLPAENIVIDDFCPEMSPQLAVVEFLHIYGGHRKFVHNERLQGKAGIDPDGRDAHGCAESGVRIAHASGWQNLSRCPCALYGGVGRTVAGDCIPHAGHSIAKRNVLNLHHDSSTFLAYHQIALFLYQVRLPLHLLQLLLHVRGLSSHLRDLLAHPHFLIVNLVSWSAGLFCTS